MFLVHGCVREELPDIQVGVKKRIDVFIYKVTKDI